MWLLSVEKDCDVISDICIAGSGSRVRAISRHTPALRFLQLSRQVCDQRLLLHFTFSDISL